MRQEFVFNDGELVEVGADAGSMVVFTALAAAERPSLHDDFSIDDHTLAFAFRHPRPWRAGYRPFAVAMLLVGVGMWWAIHAWIGWLMGNGDQRGAVAPGVER